VAKRGFGSEHGQVSVLFLVLAAILALGISIAGSYLVVVSQNPSSNVSGPSFVYGSPSPP
jgi:uncharacterized protein (UPF0333 family)